MAGDDENLDAMLVQAKSTLFQYLNLAARGSLTESMRGRVEEAVDLIIDVAVARAVAEIARVKGSVPKAPKPRAQRDDSPTWVCARCGAVGRFDRREGCLNCKAPSGC